MASWHRVREARSEATSRRRGFSLIEVLLSVFILGIGVISIAALFPAGIAQQRQSVDDITGPIVAQNALAILRTKLRTEDFCFGSGYTVDCDLGWSRPAFFIDDVTLPDGTTITRNSQSDSNQSFVDFNNSGDQQINSFDIDDQMFENDEPYLAMAPFLAVFDDDEAREIKDTTAWGDEIIRREDITDYVTQFAKRIHFNRYTGVVMK